MPPRAKGGKWAGTRYARPTVTVKPYPGMRDKLEREYQSDILALCKKKGLTLVFHDPNSKDIATKARGVGTGFPDLWIVGERGMLVRELKRFPGGAVTPEQADWIDALAKLGVNADVWWVPNDLTSGRVENELNGICRRGPLTSDLVSETGKLMYLATTSPAEVPAAATHWDAGTAFVNRALWRKEARLLLHRAAEALPVGDDEIRVWLRDNQLRPDASPAEVLHAARRTLTRHEELPA